MHRGIRGALNTYAMRRTKLSPLTAHARASGQTLIEFSVTLPLLALLLFGVIQYGFILSAYMTLRHAAHLTARTVSLAGYDASNPSNTTAIAGAAITPMLNPANLTAVNVSTTTVADLSAMNVQLNYNLPLIVRFVVPSASGNILALKANATYRKN